MLKSLIFRELSISLVGYFFTQILLRYTTLKKNDIILQPKSENSSFYGFITTSSLLKVFNDKENSFC